MRWITLSALALFIAGFGCKKQKAQTSQSGDIVIGEFASTTGGTATFGVSSDRGLKLAIEQANAAGGVLGRHITLKVVDDASDVNQAVTAVQKLINDDGVIAVVGEVASKRSLAGAAICERYKVPMLSPASTNPAVTVDNGQTRPWIFRVCFTDDFQGRANGQFAIAKGWEKVAVMTDTDEDYSKGLAKFFKESLKGHGQIVADEAYRNSDRDFQSQLTRIKDAGPDAVYVPGYYTEVGLIAKQAVGIGLTVPFFGGDGWDSTGTRESEYTQGYFYSDHYTADDPSPRVQEFVKAYTDRYGEGPDAMAVLGYDAGKVLIDAISRAGKAEPTAIRDALASTKNFPGASGTITIDAGHNARKPIVQLQIRDKRARLVKTFAPEELEGGK